MGLGQLRRIAEKSNQKKRGVDDNGANGSENLNISEGGSAVDHAFRDVNDRFYDAVIKYAPCSIGLSGQRLPGGHRLRGDAGKLSLRQRKRQARDTLAVEFRAVENVRREIVDAVAAALEGAEHGLLADLMTGYGIVPLTLKKAGVVDALHLVDEDNGVAKWMGRFASNLKVAQDVETVTCSIDRVPKSDSILPEDVGWVTLLQSGLTVPLIFRTMKKPLEDLISKTKDERLMEVLKRMLAEAENPGNNVRGHDILSADGNWCHVDHEKLGLADVLTFAQADCERDLITVDIVAKKAHQDAIRIFAQETADEAAKSAEGGWHLHSFDMSESSSLGQGYYRISNVFKNY